MPLFQDRDFYFIEYAIKNNIDYVGVSYLRNVEEVSFVYDLLKDSKTEPIFKIETKEVLSALDDILSQVRKVILDRGDLAAELGIYNLLEAQERIIERCRQHHVDLYVATQVLFHLVENAAPLIPEILELTRLIRSDIQGIQFSDECAIGIDPAKCIKILRDIEETVKKGEREMFVTTGVY